MIPASAKRAFEEALDEYLRAEHACSEQFALDGMNQGGPRVFKAASLRAKVIALALPEPPVASEGVDLKEAFYRHRVVILTDEDTNAVGRLLPTVCDQLVAIVAASQRGVDYEPITPTDPWRAYESACVMYCTHVRAHRAGAIRIAAVQAAWQEVERAQAKAIASDAALGRGGE